MTKHLRLLFLVFMSYSASISLAYSQPDSSKKTKVQIKKLLTSGNNLNLKKIDANFISTIKEGLVSQIRDYFTEKNSEKEVSSEEEFYTYLEQVLAPELAFKIYCSLLRDQIENNGESRKIVKKTKKTEEELNTLYKAEKAVAKFLFNGTIILLSILDKEEYKYIRIFLEELQLLATLPPSYQPIRAFCSETFNKSVFAMQILKQFYSELHDFTEGFFESINGIDDKEDEGEKIDLLSIPKKLLSLPRATLSKLIEKGYQIKSLVPLNIPGSKKVKVAIATIIIAGVTIPVLVYFDIANPNCLVCPSDIGSIQRFCDGFC